MTTRYKKSHREQCIMGWTWYLLLRATAIENCEKDRVLKWKQLGNFEMRIHLIIFCVKPWYRTHVGLGHFAMDWCWIIFCVKPWYRMLGWDTWTGVESSCGYNSGSYVVIILLLNIFMLLTIIYDCHTLHTCLRYWERGWFLDGP